jgi:hypothetical protein
MSDKYWCETRDGKQQERISFVIGSGVVGMVVGSILFVKKKLSRTSSSFFHKQKRDDGCGSVAFGSPSVVPRNGK